MGWVQGKSISGQSVLVWEDGNSTVESPTSYLDTALLLDPAAAVVTSGLASSATTQSGTSSADTIVCKMPAPNVFYGSAVNSVIQGTALSDNIYGGTGDDVIEAGAGNDWVFGESGNDTLSGGLGDDQLHGGAGDDVITDTDGNNLFFGDEGNDHIIAGGVSADISGGGGNDLIESSVTGTIWGDGGNDTFNLSGGRITLYTGPGTDHINLVARPGGDLSTSLPLYNPATDLTVRDMQVGDTLKLIWPSLADPHAAGFPDVTPGSGFYVGPIQTLTATGLDFRWGYGNTHVFLEGVKDYLAWDAATDVFFLRSPAQEGTSGDDTLSGTAQADVLNGNAGNDTLNGFAGIDILDGGTGTDTLSGGDGNDTLNGGADFDIFDGGEGNDTIFGDALSEPDGAGGTMAFAGDYIIAGAGDDVIYGDLGPLVGYRHWAETNYGGDDYIDGGAGNDRIYAQGGNDNLWGGDGDDILSGGAGDDYISGGAGNDIIETGIGVDHVWGDAGANTYHLGYGAPVSYTATTYIHDFHAGDRLGDRNTYDFPLPQYANTYTQQVMADGLHMIEVIQTIAGSFTHEVILTGVFQTLTFDTASAYYHL